MDLHCEQVLGQGRDNTQQRLLIHLPEASNARLAACRSDAIASWGCTGV